MWNMSTEEPINYHSYFELDTFKHRAIFHEHEAIWEVLGRIHLYLSKQHLGVIEGFVDSAAHLIDSDLISIGKGSIVEPGAYIKGPCIIGENCVIRHGAYVRGDLIAGDGCIIGHDTEIKKAILLNGAQAAHFAYVGDSILGNGVNLGAGVKCANLKLNHNNIEITGFNFKIDTGMRKLGAIIGDHAQVGCNSVLNPGTLVGKNSFIHPCLSVHGIIPENHVIKSTSHVIIQPKNI